MITACDLYCCLLPQFEALLLVLLDRNSVVRNKSLVRLAFLLRPSFDFLFDRQ